jgi:hypothetical protein
MAKQHLPGEPVAQHREFMKTAAALGCVDADALFEATLKRILGSPTTDPERQVGRRRADASPDDNLK